MAKYCAILTRYRMRTRRNVQHVIKIMKCIITTVLLAPNIRYNTYILFNGWECNMAGYCNVYYAYYIIILIVLIDRQRGLITARSTVV